MTDIEIDALVEKEFDIRKAGKRKHDEDQEQKNRDVDLDDDESELIVSDYCITSVGEVSSDDNLPAQASEENRENEYTVQNFDCLKRKYVLFMEGDEQSQAFLKKYIGRTLNLTLARPCLLCDYVAKNNSTLVQHRKSKHEGVRYPCEYCDYYATTTGNLKKHIKSVHEGVRYPCDECDYTATEVGNLKKHINSKHKGIRYQCDECDHVVTKSSYLKPHKLAKHSGLR